MSKLKANEIVADKWTSLDGSENYKCRAWVNFNGVGVVAVNAAGNVSSVTDVGVGAFRVNFAKPLPHAKYAIAGFTSWNTTNTAGIVGGNSTFEQTVDGFDVKTANSTTGAATDTAVVMIQVVG